MSAVVVPNRMKMQRTVQNTTLKGKKKNYLWKQPLPQLFLFWTTVLQTQLPWIESRLYLEVFYTTITETLFTQVFQEA